MEHIGIDLGKTSSQLCILTEDGELIERRIKTSRDDFFKWLGNRAPARILIEATTESEWVARGLEQMGHEIVVADPNFAPMYATRSRRVKTDKRDARTLCEACRLGSYRHAHRTSEPQRQIKKMLTVREMLVRTRAKYITSIKTLVRAEGLRVPASEAKKFSERLSALTLPQHLAMVLSPLVTLLTELNKQIELADRQLQQLAKSDPVVERLCTAPGVGPVTAITFVATLDEVTRFDTAKQVRGYLGLVPSEKSSGEMQHRGRITKAGNVRLRSLLVEAAWSLLRSKQESVHAIQQWARSIALRRGKCVAAVALARKLAGILYAMWRDGTSFGDRHRTLEGGAGATA
ncbi:MAG: IS110 family transposase [Acidobacteria bacterium]|nr:IS110 family transposase [Acidobacteriota bacterium]